MTVSIRDWANAGLPLARTFVAMSVDRLGNTAESLAEASSQDVVEVRIHLREFLLPNGFALCGTDGTYVLTRNGMAKLSGDPVDSRNNRADETEIAPPIRLSEMQSAAKVRRIIAASSRKGLATG